MSGTVNINSFTNEKLFVKCLPYLYYAVHRLRQLNNLLVVALPCLSTKRQYRDEI